MARQGLENRSTIFKTRFSAKFPGANELKSRVNTQVPMGCDNNNELYLHDHTNTYSIAKAMFRNQTYNTGNYVTLTIICHEHQNKLKYIL